MSLALATMSLGCPLVRYSRLEYQMEVVQILGPRLMIQCLFHSYFHETDPWTVLYIGLYDTDIEMCFRKDFIFRAQYHRWMTHLNTLLNILLSFNKFLWLCYLSLFFPSCYISLVIFGDIFWGILNAYYIENSFWMRLTQNLENDS